MDLESFTPLVIRDLAIEAFENAKELFSESKLLLEHKKYARALYLAQIGGEEIGKHVICISAVVDHIRGKLDLNRFRKRLLNHREKMKSMMHFESYWQSAKFIAEDDLDDYSRFLETTKLEALYSETAKGKAIRPSILIGKELAQYANVWLKRRIKLVDAIGIISLLRSQQLPNKETFEQIRKKRSQAEQLKR